MADTEDSLDTRPSPFTTQRDTLLTSPGGEAEYREVRHGFTVADQPLMLAANVLSEITSGAKICAIPDTPPWFSGFINHRGHTVPVYDLQYWLTETPVDRRQTVYILLFGTQPHTAGILLEQFPTVLTDPKHMDQTPPPRYPELEAFARTGYNSQGQCWVEIDHSALLNHLKNNFHQPVAKAEAQDNS